MKRILLASLVVGLLVGAIALSGGAKIAKTELQVEVEARNPWTNLRLNNAPENFHFVVVSDRTGGHRARIFSQAVEQINLLQPAFVVSVGDLIEGYTKDTDKLASEWKEFQTYAQKLHMPFFYVPGNHDLSNPGQIDVWKEHFGRRSYHFLYKDVLFLAVNSEDPRDAKAKEGVGPEQIEYFRKVLKENPNVRWTFVCIHKPLWAFANLESNGWLEMEKLLNGRNYTVFAGHVHRYQKFVRQGMNHYQLATTGGGSKLRGLRYGEFDHVAWVTMKTDSNPVIANLLLDGIYPENMKKTITAEEGVVVYNRKPVYPVRGKVIFDGAPAANAQVIFWRPDPKNAKKLARASDAWVEADGSYAMSTYIANDGLQEGDYKITVTLREAEPTGKLGKNLLPARYATAATTDLSTRVKAGTNIVNLTLAK